MAIPKQQRHIPFNQGLNDKVDERLAPDGYVKKIKNCVFRKDGQVVTINAFDEIEDAINDHGDIRALYSVADNELFAFSPRGVDLKTDDGKFKHIADKNFFDNVSRFVSREEERIHDPSISLTENYMLVAYQIKPLPDSSIRWFLIDRATGLFVRRGLLLNAREPMTYLTASSRGFVYKDVNYELKSFDVDANLTYSLVDGLNTKLFHPDTDVTSLVKVSQSEFVFMIRGWNDTANLNAIRLLRFNFGTRQAYLQKQITLTNLGSRQDLGRLFGNTLVLGAPFIDICTTTRVGLSSSTIDVYRYNLGTNEFEFSFFASVTNNFRNEIIGAFADTERKSLLYYTSGADVFSYREGGVPKQILDTYALMDMFQIEGKNFYLVANITGYFVLNENFRFVNKMNEGHNNVFQDVRKTRVTVDGNNCFFPTPRLTSIEGFTQRGYAMYYNTLQLDEDQNRECERFGDGYYLITSSPLTFYDKRQVVEYGFSKRPKLILDSRFKV